MFKNEFFTREAEYAKKIGFLEQGIVRSYFTGLDGKEFSKHFFVAPTIIGAYTLLLTSQPTKISHQALTDSTIMVAHYNKIIELYDKHHSLERMGRKLAEFFYVEKESNKESSYLNLIVLYENKHVKKVEFKKEMEELEDLGIDGLFTEYPRKLSNEIQS